MLNIHLGILGICITNNYQKCYWECEYETYLYGMKTLSDVKHAEYGQLKVKGQNEESQHCSVYEEAPLVCSSGEIRGSGFPSIMQNCVLE